MGAAPHDTRWSGIADVAARDPRIQLINETKNREDLIALFRSCDALVSLHRAEGFGRTIAEAMLLGKPTIATAWSGNLDFCTPETCALVNGKLIPIGPNEYPWGEGLYWCDPHIDEAAAAMNRILSDAQYRQHIAHNARRLVSSRHAPEVVGEEYRRRLSALGLLSTS